MILSQPSWTADPLADVLTVLDARAIRMTRFEGSGNWALRFPALERLKIVAIVRGVAWLTVPGKAAVQVTAGDCCLIGRSAYTIASDPTVPHIDGALLFADGIDVLRFGGDDTVALGGGIAFTTEVGAFLLDMLPATMHVPGNTAGSTTIAAILALLDAETTRAGIGSEIVKARLAEVLMLEAIRALAAAPDVIGGWFGALADPRIGRAIRGVHADIGRPWTVAHLAAEAGMSRAAFSAAFSRRLGLPPLAYVRNWRMTRARIALSSRRGSVSDVAADVGYTSLSAFGHAFRRHFGIAPRGGSD